MVGWLNIGSNVAALASDWLRNFGLVFLILLRNERQNIQAVLGRWCGSIWGPIWQPCNYVILNSTLNGLSTWAYQIIASGKRILHLLVLIYRTLEKDIIPDLSVCLVFIYPSFITFYTWPSYYQTPYWSSLVPTLISDVRVAYYKGCQYLKTLVCTSHKPVT